MNTKCNSKFPKIQLGHLVHELREIQKKTSSTENEDGKREQYDAKEEKRQ